MTRVTAAPELLVVLAVAGVLNLWNLSINGTANSYYAAAVKSMASSWHDFLYNSMDKAGLMTVDKPPLSDWIQALSVRVFGYSSWSMLVPQALMGVLAAGLAYDLVRRRFGRVGGFVAGFALATTPTIVAVSRHNNPDELLVLLSVAAMWFALRAIETGRTRWIVWSGVMVGLGFETKMGVALMIVPGIALAWCWMRWTPGSGIRGRVRGNLRMIRQLVWGGLAMTVVGLAWPVLVTLTPAADRPWISGTADNSVWSLIFSYNGVGRIAGQSGGPSGGGGIGGHMGGGNSMFGGGTGVFRLLGSSLGSQAGWLLGAAVVSAIALVVMSRLRRRDARTGFVLMVGVTLAVISVVFSFASGIFHPYYVSMVAPWAALLIGAGVGEMLGAPWGVAGSERSARIVGAAVVVGGAITELVVIGNSSDVPGWATPVAIIAGLLGLGLLIVQLSKRVRVVLVGVALAAMFATPVAWASETLGHATSGTFPTGGPASAESGGGFGGMGGSHRGFGGSGSRSGFGSGMGSGSASGGGFGGSGSSSSGRSTPGGSSGSSSSSPAASSSSNSGSGAVSQLFNSGSSSSSSNAPSGAPSSSGGAPSSARSGSGGGWSMPGGSGSSSMPGGSSGSSGSGSSSSSSSGFGGAPSGSSSFGGGSSSGGFGGGMGGAGGSSSLEAAAKYAEEHGGGTVVVESQSTAAEAILAGYTNVAGIGGFSGNESTVSAQWIAKMVSEGRLRYIFGGSADSVSSPSDGRSGSAKAIEIAESVAKKITVKVSGQSIVLYDLQGKAAAILAAAAKA